MGKRLAGAQAEAATNGVAAARGAGLAQQPQLADVPADGGLRDRVVEAAQLPDQLLLGMDGPAFDQIQDGALPVGLVADHQLACGGAGVLGGAGTWPMTRSSTCSRMAMARSTSGLPMISGGTIRITRSPMALTSRPCSRAPASTALAMSRSSTIAAISPEPRTSATQSKPATRRRSSSSK